MAGRAESAAASAKRGPRLVPGRLGEGLGDRPGCAAAASITRAPPRTSARTAAWTVVAVARRRRPPGPARGGGARPRRSPRRPGAAARSPRPRSGRPCGARSARPRSLGVDAQQDGQVGPDPAGREVADLLDPLDAEPARHPLVGDARVAEAVADHVAALAPAAGPITSATSSARAAQKSSSSASGSSSSAGSLSSSRIRSPVSVPPGSRTSTHLVAQRLGEQLGLGRLARPVDSLERDEHRRPRLTPARSRVRAASGNYLHSAFISEPCLGSGGQQQLR